MTADQLNKGDTVYHRAERYLGDVTGHATEPMTGKRLVMVQPLGSPVTHPVDPALLAYVDA